MKARPAETAGWCQVGRHKFSLFIRGRPNLQTVPGCTTQSVFDLRPVMLCVPRVLHHPENLKAPNQTNESVVRDFGELGCRCGPLQSGFRGRWLP